MMVNTFIYGHQISYSNMAPYWHIISPGTWPSLHLPTLVSSSQLLWSMRGCVILCNTSFQANFLNVHHLLRLAGISHFQFSVPTRSPARNCSDFKKLAFVHCRHRRAHTSCKPVLFITRSCFIFQSNSSCL